MARASPPDDVPPATASTPTLRQAPAPEVFHGHLQSVNDVDVAVISPPISPLSSSLPAYATPSSSLLLASASDDGTARLWDTARRRTTKAVRWREEGAGKQQPVLCCLLDRLCPSSILYTAHGSRSRIAVWSIAEDDAPVVSRPLCVLSIRTEDEKSDEDEVNQLLISADGSLLCVCDDSGRWFTWHIRRGCSSADTATSTAAALRFSPGSTVRMQRQSAVSVDASSSLPCAFTCVASSPTAHSNLCVGIAFVSADRLVSVGFDYRLHISAADGSRTFVSADVRELLSKFHTPAAPTLTNPPFPQCVAASSSSVVLVGLGSGALLWLDAASLSLGVIAVQEDAHASAVVCVRYVGSSEADGAEYWVSAGSDRRLGLWRTQKARQGQVDGKRRSKKKKNKPSAPQPQTDPPIASASSPSIACELSDVDWSALLERLTLHVPSVTGPASRGGESVVSLLWTAQHPVKLNAVHVTVMVEDDVKAARIRPVVRSLSVWACGISSAVYRYEVPVP